MQFVCAPAFVVCVEPSRTFPFECSFKRKQFLSLFCFRESLSPVPPGYSPGICQCKWYAQPSGFGRVFSKLDHGFFPLISGGYHRVDVIIEPRPLTWTPSEVISFCCAFFRIFSFKVLRSDFILHFLCSHYKKVFTFFYGTYFCFLILARLLSHFILRVTKEVFRRRVHYILDLRREVDYVDLWNWFAGEGVSDKGGERAKNPCRKFLCYNIFVACHLENVSRLFL